MLKKLLYSFTLAIVSQANVNAQSCTGFLPLVSGNTYQYQILRGPNLKPFGRFDFQISSTEDSGLTGKLNVVQVRKSGKPIAFTECNYIVHCTKDSVNVNPDSTDFSNLSLGHIVLPNQLEVGQNLPDKTTKYFYDKRRPDKQTGMVRIYRTKVTKKEMIEVPAGKFEAFLVESDKVSKTGNNWMNTNYFSLIPVHYKDWYVPGKGFVKSERYSGKSLLITIVLSEVTNAKSTITVK